MSKSNSLGCKGTCVVQRGIQNHKKTASWPQYFQAMCQYAGQLQIYLIRPVLYPKYMDC